MKTPNPLLAKFLPFLMLGLMIVLFIIGVIFFSYVLIIAVIIGAILYAVAYIRLKFFTPKKPAQKTGSTGSKGRVIDHDK